MYALFCLIFISGRATCYPVCTVIKFLGSLFQLLCRTVEGEDKLETVSTFPVTGGVLCVEPVKLRMVIEQSLKNILKRSKGDVFFDSFEVGIQFSCISIYLTVKMLSLIVKHMIIGIEERIEIIFVTCGTGGKRRLDLFCFFRIENILSAMRLCVAGQGFELVGN